MRREPVMVVVHRSFRYPECREYSLVLHAMDIDHELERGVFGWRVLVTEYDAAFAREQWRLYQLENRPRPVRQHNVEPRPGAALGAAAWAGALLVHYWLQSNFVFGIDWAGAGAADAGAIQAGEWWRTITALTLHADGAHLFANIGIGAVFGALLAREIGTGYAWALILFGGAAGNYLNALVQSATHLSVGASTAVFAALGILGAWLWTARRMLAHSWATRASPVVFAIVMLAWLGTGDENTDIVAHLTGFIAGFVLGVILGRRPERPGADVSQQWRAGGGALLALFFAWSIALGG
jgi:membrane associated rhomboid family serine protease